MIDVIASVRGLAAHKAPGLEYEVVSPTCIKIPARNAARLKDAREVLKKAVGKDAVALAEQQLKEAGEIVTWFHIEDGKAASLKTFDRQAAQDLLPLFTVQLAAVEAVYSEFINKNGILVKKTELQVRCTFLVHHRRHTLNLSSTLSSVGCLCPWSAPSRPR